MLGVEGPSVVGQRHAGHDVVRLAGKHRHVGSNLNLRARLAHEVVAVHHDRVGAEHHRVRVFAAGGQGLLAGDHLQGVANGEAARGHFVDWHGVDLEVVQQVAQQHVATR